MSLITKSELKYDYSWTVLNGDNPKITGVPDSTLLNRNEGYEVLWFINKFAEKHNFKNKESAFKIERMLKSHLPENIRSQENVVGWIEDNWDKY